MFHDEKCIKNILNVIMKNIFDLYNVRIACMLL